MAWRLLQSDMVDSVQAKSFLRTLPMRPNSTPIGTGFQLLQLAPVEPLRSVPVHTVSIGATCPFSVRSIACPMFPLFSSTQHYRLQHIAHHQAAAGFEQPPDHREGAIQFFRRHVLDHRVHDRDVDGCFGHFPQILQRTDPDFGVRGKSRDQAATHARRRLGEVQLAAGFCDKRCG